MTATLDLNHLSPDLVLVLATFHAFFEGVDTLEDVSRARARLRTIFAEEFARELEYGLWALFSGVLDEIPSPPLWWEVLDRELNPIPDDLPEDARPDALTPEDI